MHRRRKGRAVPLAVIAIVLTMAARTGPPAPAQWAAQPAAADPWFRALASPFGTIHEATFRFSPPIGAEIPAIPGFHLAAAAANADALPDDDEDALRDWPVVDRSLDGARLTPGDADGVPAAGADSEAAPYRDTAAAGGDVMRVAQIYFITVSPGTMGPVMLEPWPAEPPGPDIAAPPAALPPPYPPPRAEEGREGEATGESAGQRPRSPAELLDLAGPARARQEKCLADAIYFEARGEPVRGQMAVAQVVINRVFSGYYPGNVCGVVYQHTRRHRRLRCQFSFTCDGIPDRVGEPDAWQRAVRIARDALDGHFWLDDIGKATHYHARWVHPRWVREMRRLDRIGVHTFYRPRRWGDGANSPVWGDASGKVERL